MATADVRLRPPYSVIGSKISVIVEVQFDGTRRRRERDDVSDIVSRWVIRWVERHFTGYALEGSSTSVEPGRTYFGWWFGWVEVYLGRITA